MAEKKQTATYESIMRDLKNRKFAPIYILQGDEPYFIDKICDYLAENVLKPEERDFNQVILFGAETTDQRVADEALAYPMMADHRVVIVKESQDMKGNGSRLARYFEKPAPTTILVLCHKGGKIDGRSQVAKRFRLRLSCLRVRRNATMSCRLSSVATLNFIRQPSTTRPRR